MIGILHTGIRKPKEASLFLLLLTVSLVVAIATTALVLLFFRGSISGILGRIVAEPVAAAWRRYVSFALLVVGISSGVSLWTLERYVQAPGNAGAVQTAPPALATSFPAPITTEAWVLEVYRTALGSLRGLSGALLLFFAIALVVSGIQRGLGERGAASGDLRRGLDRGRGRGLAPVANGRSEGRGGENRANDGRRPLSGGSGRRGDPRSRDEGRARDGEGRREGDLRRDLRVPRPADARSGEQRGREARSVEPGASPGTRGPGDGRAPDGRLPNGDAPRNGTLERRPLPSRP